MDTSVRPVSVDPERILVTLGNATHRPTVVTLDDGLERAPATPEPPQPKRPVKGRPKKKETDDG